MIRKANEYPGFKYSKSIFHVPRFRKLNVLPIRSARRRGGTVRYRFLTSTSLQHVLARISVLFAANVRQISTLDRFQVAACLQ